MNEASKLFCSNLDQFRARIFYKNYLLPAVRDDISKNKKLNYHYYYALKKALYKPAAWFKGILFPLAKVLLFYFQEGKIRESEIVASVITK